MIENVLRLFGKNYSPDPALPFAYFFKLCARRIIWLIRGFLKTGVLCYAGPRVTIDHIINLTIGKNCTFENDVWINAVCTEPMIIGDQVRIGAFTRIMGAAHLSKVGRFFRIGKNSSCGEFCFFGAAGGIAIGENVMIGQYVSFHAQNHNFSEVNLPINEQGTTEKGIIVEDDCWIGAKATVLDGTKIGRHSVVAAGAVVSGEFPACSLIAGVPAKIIRDLKEVHHG
jgi:acetyltransferase-like isoleucine patch superfamily enzyme